MGRSGNAEDWISQARRRLAVRHREKPATKAGQIRALWPEIQTAIENGQTLKSIRQWLEEEAGIVLSITSFTSYISRIRRREGKKPGLQTAVQPPLEVARASTSTTTNLPQRTLNDPLALAMQALSNSRLDIRRIHGDGDPQGKNLI